MAARSPAHPEKLYGDDVSRPPDPPSARISLLIKLLLLLTAKALRIKSIAMHYMEFV